MINRVDLEPDPDGGSLVLAVDPAGMAEPLQRSWDRPKP